SRTEHHAARQGHPAHWTWDNLQAARLQANATARPHGLYAPTPDGLWDTRPTLSHNARASFHACLNRQRQQARLELNYPTEGPLQGKDDRALDRIAIRRALVEHGYLLFSRRRLPLPFNTKKAADIP